MDFDESLPSASTFYPHEEAATIIYQPIPKSESKPLNSKLISSEKEWTPPRKIIYQHPESPAPPPPPINFEENDKYPVYSNYDSYENHSNHSNHLNHTIHQSSRDFPSFQDRSDSLNHSLYDQDKYDDDDHNGDNDNGDIVLNGSQYFGVPVSSKQSSKQSASTKNYSKANSSSTNILDESSTIASLDWKTKTAKQKIELDEFELLEKQAQTMMEQNPLNMSKSMSRNIVTPIHSNQSNHSSQPGYHNVQNTTLQSTSSSSSSSLLLMPREYMNQDSLKKTSSGLRYSYEDGSENVFQTNIVYDDDERDNNDQDRESPSNINQIFETVTTFLGDKYDHNDVHDDNNHNSNNHDEIERNRFKSTNSDRHITDNILSQPSQKVIHSPPRNHTATIREFQRWGAMTQPDDTEDSIYSHENDSISNNPSRLPSNRSSSASHQKLSSTVSGRVHRPIMSQNRDNYSKEDDMSEISSATDRSSFAQTVVTPISTRALRPSLSARTLKARPTSASRPIIKPPKNLNGQQQDNSPNRNISSYSKNDNISDLNPGLSEENRTSLAQKAKELEDELETYRKENATLKQLRKQQENVLEDTIRQKNETMQSITEEKRKVERFCEENRQAALKDRRTAAKILRDARLKVGSDSINGTAFVPVSIRNAKQEIDALQATVEKMKTDHEIAIKKHKLNERRYQQLVKDQQKNIESLENRISTIELEKTLLFSFIDKSDLRIPSSLKAIRSEQPLHSDKSKLASTTGFGRVNHNHPVVAKGKGSGLTVSKTIDSKSSMRRKGYGDSFAEELDNLDQLISTRVTSTYYDELQDHEEEEDDDNDDDDNNNNDNEDHGEENGELQNHDVQDDQDNTEDVEYQHRTTSDEPYYQPPNKVKSERLDEMSKRYLATNNNNNNSNSNVMNDTSSSKNPMGLGVTEELRQSWARSSRSSRGSRYSDDGKSSAQTLNIPTSNPLLKSPSTVLTDTQIKLDSSSSSSSSKPMSVTSDKILKKVQSNQPTSSSSTSLSNDNISALAYARTEEVLSDGTTMIRYRNGTSKQIFPDGRSIVNFVNGDTKTSDTTGLIIYYYAQAKTTHTTYPDGLQVYDFPNGQVEKHFQSGRKEILFPDRTKKIIYPDGIQESYFPDGVAVREYPDSTKEVISQEFLQRRGIP